MSELIGPVYTAKDYAGFLRRTAALLVDLVILLLAYVGLCYAWYFLAPLGGDIDSALAQILLAWLILALAYMIGFRLLERGTPGYRLVGIRYAHMLSERPSVMWTLSRSLWAVFLMLFFGLDHFWILFDERKQAWHDKISGF